MSTMKFCKGMSLGLIVGIGAGMCIAANSKGYSKMLSKRNGKKMACKAKRAAKEIIENITDAIG